MTNQPKLEERLNQVTTSNTPIKGGAAAAFLINDPTGVIGGVLYNGKKLADPEQLRGALAQRDETQALLNLHRSFDALRDSIKRKEMTPETAIETALMTLGEKVDAGYIGLRINPLLKEEGKTETEYQGADFISARNDEKKLVFNPLPEQGHLYFEALRERNKILAIDFGNPQSQFLPDLEKRITQLPNAKRKVSGDGITIYLKPGHDTVAALQILQAKKIGEPEGRFISEWVLLADTFISDVLGISVDPRFAGQEATGSVAGIDFNTLGEDYEGAGDYKNRGEAQKTAAVPQTQKKGWKFYKDNSYFANDDNFMKIRDSLTGFLGNFMPGGIPLSDLDLLSPEKIQSEKFKRAKRFVTDKYQKRPEIDIKEGEDQKDSNSAISLMRIVVGLFDQYKAKLCEENKFVLPDGREVDSDTLENAAIFVAGFARAIKYMPEADDLNGAERIRLNNDIREMTSYLGGLVEHVNGRFSYAGEPLVDKAGKPSLLGSTIMHLSQMINPSIKGHIVSDVMEKAIQYEELVQDSTSSPAVPMEEALMQMYSECIIRKDNKPVLIKEREIECIKMIDALVNPEGQMVYSMVESDINDLRPKKD